MAERKGCWEFAQELRKKGTAKEAANLRAYYSGLCMDLGSWRGITLIPKQR